MKLKIEKGFTINKDEAESKARTELKGALESANSAVSTALTQN